MDEQAEQLVAKALREQEQKVRRGWLLRVLGSCVLVAFLVGMMLGRLMDSGPAEVLKVDYQDAGLVLTLNQSVEVLRTEAPGAVQFIVPGAKLPAGLAQGKVRQGDVRLSWRVEQTAQGVEVLLVSLTGNLQVELKQYKEQKQWQLLFALSPAAKP